MRLQAKYNKHENDCFNLLTVDPNPLHDLNHFSLILRLENTYLQHKLGMTHNISEATQTAAAPKLLDRVQINLRGPGFASKQRNPSCRQTHWDEYHSPR